MARKKKVLPEIENVEIVGIAAEGKSLAKIKLNESDPNSIVVFVPYGAPGDNVNIKIDKKKHSFAEGHITKLNIPSPLRIKPECEYFTLCGGCKWQHIPYEEQLKFKRQQIIDALSRIGKVEIPEVSLTIGSENIWEYRNKMEYTFSNKRWKSWEELRGEKIVSVGEEALGFHIPGAFDKVLHINDCRLQDKIGNKIRNYLYSEALKRMTAMQDHFQDTGISLFYDIKQNKGFFRTLIIRPTTTGELMVCIVVGEKEIYDEKGNDLVNEIFTGLIKEFPEITTLAWVVNKKVNDSIADQEVKIFYGPGYVEEKLGDLKFRISPKSFYQTNSRQAEKLYQVAASFAGLTEEYSADEKEKPLVYDLYTGAGTIANYVAKYAKRVIGIEYVEDAIKDARINSEINGIANTEFFAGDMKDILTETFIYEHGRPDIMIVDPPRAGMHEDVVEVIKKASPETIVYVSCNPATQARDIALLDTLYKVTRVQPVDMFPHTHHVENVVKLEKRTVDN